MLVNVSEVLAMPEYSGANSASVKAKIAAIENAIRAYTNNSFIVRGARITAPSRNGAVLGTSPFISAGDRVLVTRSALLDDCGELQPVHMNDGLYDVQSVTDSETFLEGTLYDAYLNDVFLVRYPEAIKAGAMELLKWDANGREKIGVASETISRHSVSYYQFTEAEMLNGYPASLMGFLKPFVKARF